MSKSLKSNYIFNLINTVSQILFPIITFPYASRIMLPDGIGQVNFFTSIINYITLFASLGIPVYAIKAIAACRNDATKLNQTTLEIVSLNLILTFFAYVAVGIFSFVIPKIAADVPLFLILSLSIVFTTIGCEWFYKGIEDFKYITIRGIIVKILSIILLFCFVKSKEDILIYGLYTVIGSIGGNIFNFIRLRKYVSIKGVIRTIKPFRHLKPILQVFLFSAITSIYLQLNTVILGFMKSASDVGIYTTAVKLFSIVNSIIGSLGIVMLPRISNLVAENNVEEVKRLAQKSYDFSFSLSLPLILGIIVCCPSLIHLFCGDSFMDAVPCIQIIAPIMLFLSISSLLGYQILYPMGHLNLVVGYCLIGSITCIIFDLLLIPGFSYIGVSFSYMLTELIVALISIFVSRKFIRIDFYTRTQRNTLISTFSLAIVFILLRHIEIKNDLLVLCTYALVGVLTYSFSMILLKDELYMECTKIIHSKFRNKI